MPAGFFLPSLARAGISFPEAEESQSLHFREFRKASTGNFEIAASIYPWDLADEGVETVFDNLQQKSACNSAYLIGIMHREKRPPGELFFPHNPNRKYYIPEDGCVYWKPDLSFYKRIKPALVVHDEFLKGTDWLDMLVKEARKRNMKTGVELSHTLINLERADHELSDCIQVNAAGQRLFKFLCPNNPDVRDYLKGLYSDLVTHYDLDFIQTCMIMFEGGKRDSHPALRIMGLPDGGCFCESCRKKAAGMGIDLEKIRKSVLPMVQFVDHPTDDESFQKELLKESGISSTAILMEHPELIDFLVFRKKSVDDFFKMIHDTAKAIKPGIELRYNAHRKTDEELYGIDPSTMSQWVDSFRASHYGEETGDASQIVDKRKFLLGLRYNIGEEKPLISAISIRKNSTPALIGEAVLMAKKCGIDGISLGHYDCGTFYNMEAIRPALDNAGIEYREVWENK